MKVADAAGAVLYEQGVPLLWTSNDGSRRVGQLVLPDQGLTVYVVGAASGEVDPDIKAGQMQLEVYQTGTEGAPIATQIVTQGQPVDLAGLKFTFVRERQFTGLIVARDPGALFVWLGAALLVGGHRPRLLLPEPPGLGAHPPETRWRHRPGRGGRPPRRHVRGRVRAPRRRSEARPDRAERRLKEGISTDVQDVGVQLPRRRPLGRPGPRLLPPGLRLGPSRGPRPDGVDGRSGRRSGRRDDHRQRAQPEHEQPGDLRDPARPTWRSSS